MNLVLALAYLFCLALPGSCLAMFCKPFFSTLYIRDRTKDFRPDTERDLLGGLISAETRYLADRILSAERVNFGRYYPKATKFWPKLTIKVSYFGRYALFRPKFLYRSFRLSGRYLSGASEVISIGRKPKESSFVRSLLYI